MNLYYIAHVANAVGGLVFTTKPAKSVDSDFSKNFNEVTATNEGIKVVNLIDSNDPLAIVKDEVTKDSDDNIFTLATTAEVLFNNLPYLNGLQNSKIVIHAQLPKDEFSYVSSLKDSGFTILLSNNALEAHDMSIVAYLLATAISRPVLHFFSPSDACTEKNASFLDQYTIRAIIHQVIHYFDTTTCLEETKIKQLIENFKVDVGTDAYNTNNKITAGDVDELIEKSFKTIAAITGNSYKSFEYIGPAYPEDVLVILGNAGWKLSKDAQNFNAGILNIRVYRPFNFENFLKNLPNSVKRLLTIEQSLQINQFQNLLLDILNNFEKLQERNIKQVVASQLGSFTNSAEVVSKLIENSRSSKPVQNLFVDITKVISSAHKLELAYFKILEQVFGSKLNILNKLDSNLKNIGTETNPEFGFGKFLFEKEQREKLIKLIQTSITENEFQSPRAAELVELLSEWVVSSNDKTETVDKADQIIALLKEDESNAASQLLKYEHYFHKNSSWLVGSDSWSYDLGSSGVHHLISSGENVNMIVFDNEPYEVVKKNKSLYRKKDIGLYAMNFGNVYVASVAVYSSYTQVLQAVVEASNFDGPSIILAYLPYESENDDSLKILQETKKSVDAGYWPLYRYNPTYEDNNEEVFKLDSSNIKKELQDFLDKENKLTLLTKKDPLLSRNLTYSLTSDIKTKQKQKAKEAYDSLLEGLTGPPLTIAFASDGGNAESLAKRLGKRGAARGLKTFVLAMDDLTLEDLAIETNLVFITSTAGQGEFPQNGRNLWDAIKNAPDLDLPNLKVAIFGLGDSAYWPRKEDKHYYNKPCKDLSKRLSLLGVQELAPLGLGDDQDADGYQTGYAEWEPKLWEALGVSGAVSVDEPPPITNEDIKIASDYLRGTIVEGLNDQSTGAIAANDQQLTKFHGIYMQDDRDIRDERKSEGLEPAYAFMARLRLPGGAATPQQWLKIDELADTRGNGTMKITTRATFQLHGVVKHDLKAAIRGMNSVLLDTLGACGDVNRNVMVSALPSNAKVHKQIAHTSYVVSEHLLPQTTAYHEIWLEGVDDNDVSPNDPKVWESRKDGPRKKKVLVSGNALVDQEPLYGPTYLPRKFKVVITVPPYNDVDVYAHDVGLIAIVDKDNIVTGYNVTVGGGMGTTHNNKKTYPRTGSLFGFIPYDKVHIACEKIMLVQRDFGDRKNRKHARLKYTIDDMGVDVYKQKVEELMGFKFERPVPFEIDSNIDYFGWIKDESGLNHYTCFIENGRVEDTPELPHKTGLREIAHYLIKVGQGEFRLTGNQHMLISNIADTDLAGVKSLLSKYKLDNTNYSGLRLSSAACVALPTCGLAMAESERYLPVLISKLEESLEEYGLKHDSIVMRMTGCPNGCSRPWLAEVALIGKAPGAYNLMLGGGYYGQRLNKLYRSSIKEDEILDILKPLFKKWSLERQDGEHFGDFLIRTGVIKPTTEGKYFHDDVPEEA
ncbi:hypothetical protein PACTADRAFT_185046 [Pachysolen tannophilus NRRL Y-2460]|uniref:Sulfite reductase [NADPH] subunit beta n=1 Tax=Pachysolen tannophilus NRRL Y-2460 TaxID=669874 RepID=A0A1E4U339_PACTA|nr:hypothetical protein PACTADRAFT_185046 [Pachysolen tannophilus NRRL Y-2460]